mgnify:CR=1 FL=1
MTALLHYNRHHAQLEIAHGLAEVVGAIGSDEFGAVIARFLHENCGADHYAVFRLRRTTFQGILHGGVNREESARELVRRYVDQQWWQRDPAMSRLGNFNFAARPNLLRVNIRASEYDGIREAIYPEVSDRLLMLAQPGRDVVGVSIIRSNPFPAFEEPTLGTISGMANLVMSLLVKHLEVIDLRADAVQAVATLGEIEACLDETTDLTPRMVEVCSRILYGMTTTGIALDLDVGEESIKTHRKRAYARLGIGSERELLKWYLSKWSTWRGLSLPLCARH